MRALLTAIWRFVYYKLTHVTEEKWRVLAICLTLSASLWFLRQMNKTYTTGMKVRMAFEYDARRYRPIEPLPDAIWLNVTAHGWPLALAAYGPGRPKLIIRPELAKGYWVADADKVKRNLQPKLSRVQINYLQDIPQMYRFDSIVDRSVPISVRLPSGRELSGELCFHGLSRSLLRLPRHHVLPVQIPRDSAAGWNRYKIPLSLLYEAKWDEVLACNEDTVEANWNP